MRDFHLEPRQLTVAEVRRNLAASSLYEHIRYEQDASIAENRAMDAHSVRLEHTRAIIDAAARSLAELFHLNAKKYEPGVSGAITTAGPS